jgi:hypothetical protein
VKSIVSRNKSLFHKRAKGHHLVGHRWRASTGPKTAQGRTRSAWNALRHALSVPVYSDKALSEEVEALARAAILGRTSLHFGRTKPKYPIFSKLFRFTTPQILRAANRERSLIDDADSTEG